MITEHSPDAGRPVPRKDLLYAGVLGPISAAEPSCIGLLQTPAEDRLMFMAPMLTCICKHLHLYHLTTL